MVTKIIVMTMMITMMMTMMMMMMMAMRTKILTSTNLYTLKKEKKNYPFILSNALTRDKMKNNTTTSKSNPFNMHMNTSRGTLTVQLLVMFR